MEGYIIVKEFDNYEINKDGLIRNRKTLRLLGGCLDKRGYRVISLIGNTGKKNLYIHRLLGEHFIENPNNKCYIDHIDGNKNNNSLNNLRWASCQENSSNKQKCKNNYMGVSIVKKTGKWASSIKINGHTIHFSTSNTEIEAKNKRDGYINENNLTFYVYI